MGRRASRARVESVIFEIEEELNGSVTELKKCVEYNTKRDLKNYDKEVKTHGQNKKASTLS